MVARFVRDEEAVGSNPATPTGNRRDRLVPAIFGLKDKKSWSEPDLSALRCEKVWFKVVGGQL